MDQKNTDHGLVALTTPQNQLESEMLQDLLRQADIPVMVRDLEGAGGYLKIYMGYSIYGETIYVHRQDLARAQELLQTLRQDSDAAILAAQPEALDDVEAFEAQEQQEQQAQPAKRADGEKSLWPAVLILAAAIVLAMWGLRY